MQGAVLRSSGQHFSGFLLNSSGWTKGAAVCFVLSTGDSGIGLDKVPALCKELEYKLAQDVLNKTLIKLSKYLELDEVKQAGVHPGNVHEYVVLSPIHLVTNYVSKLSPRRLIVAPNRPNSSTRLSINDSLHSGLHQLPAIRAVLLKFR